MACTQNFSLSPKEDEVPLDQAIYSGAQGAIYGVRGQWIYKFNATTGNKVSEFRFVDDVIFGEASIVEIGAFLYVGVWRTVFDDIATPVPPHRDVFKIAANFSSSTPLGLGALAPYVGNRWDFTFPQYSCGFTNLATNGTLLFGTLQAAGSQIFKVDPTNLPGAILINIPVGPASIIGFEYDPVNLLFWIADSAIPGINAVDQDYDINFLSNGDVGGMTSLYGVTYSPANVKVYGVNGTNGITKIDANVGLPLAGFPPSFTWSTLNILAAAAKPMRIKYNAQDGLIYVPTWSNDTVEIIDPAFDANPPVVKSGFNSPIDCVFTPSKKFAVQNSGKGLKEILP